MAVSVLVLLPVLVLGLWIGSGFIGRAIGKPKGLGTAGFWLGFGLGFIGWIIVATMQPPGPQYLYVQTGPAPGAYCTMCGQPTAPGARFCGGCGSPVGQKPNPAFPPIPAAQRRSSQPGSALAITAGCLGVAAVVLITISRRDSSGNGLVVFANLSGVRAIVLALLTLAASVLCFPTPARNIGVAALAGLAAAIVGYDGLYSSIVNSLDYGDIHWLTWSVGMLVLLGAAICASIWIARTGLSVRGARTGVLLGASGGALLLSVAALWNPIGVGSVFTYSTVDGAANALIRAIVWIGVVILAAAAADRRTRLWAIGAFAAFWLVTGWEWFADHTQYRYSNNPSITIAGWVTLVVVAGIVALIVATNKIGGTPNPKSSTHQFPA